MRFALLFPSLLLALTVSAGSLQKEQVSADAKWLLHVDVAHFLKTELGQALSQHVIDPKIAQGKSQLPFKLDFDIHKINSITAYGSDHQQQPDKNGVLLIQTGQDVQKTIDAVIDQLKDQPNPFKKLQQEPFSLYSVNDDLFASVQDQLLVLGKSKELVEKARTVLAGKAGTLASSQAFSGYPQEPKGFFFLGVAEGLKKDENAPPQAKVLQMADGGRLVIGEQAGQLFANLMLKAKDAEVSKQIRQVVEGLVALVSLSHQQDNKELLEITKSLKVDSTDKLVTVSVQVPVTMAISKFAPKKAEPSAGSAAEKKAEAEPKKE